jgi:sugar lactone lactonase YvrE
MMSTPSIEVVGFPAALGECPIWNGDRQELYWVDIDGRSVHRWHPATDQASVRNLPGRPGSIAFTTDPDVLLVAIEHQLAWLHWDSGELTAWLDLEPPGTGNRLNDGRTDPAGRFVVGSMFERVDAGRTTGILHQIEGDGHATAVRESIAVSNGIAFDPLHQRAYFADSPTGLIWVWDYDVDHGRRSNQRVFFDHRDAPGVPDGACMDSEGCYWSASVHGWSVIRLTPDGAVDRRIALPVERPTMPCFGGPDRQTLYVTSIGGSQSSPPPDGVTPAEPGSLLAVDVGGVEGIAETPFAGEPHGGSGS